MEAGSDDSWDSGLRPSRKRERLHFSTDADTTSDDSDAMSSSDGAGSDGEPHADWATDLMDSDVAMKFAVGVHARAALKYWFKGTVTAMRMRRGEALYTITFVDGMRSLPTEDIIIDWQHSSAHCNVARTSRATVNRRRLRSFAHLRRRE